MAEVFDAWTRPDHVAGWTTILIQFAGLAKVGFRAFGIVQSMTEVRAIVKKER